MGDMRCLKLNGAVLAAMRSEREGEIFIVLTAADSHASIDNDKCFKVLITLALGPFDKTTLTFLLTKTNGLSRPSCLTPRLLLLSLAV